MGVPKKEGNVRSMYCHIEFQRRQGVLGQDMLFSSQLFKQTQMGSLINRNRGTFAACLRTLPKLGRLGQEPRQAPAYPNQPLSLAIIAPWSKVLHLALMHLQDLNGTMERLENSWCVVCHLHLLNLTYPLVNIQKTIENHHFLAG